MKRRCRAITAALLLSTAASAARADDPATLRDARDRMAEAKKLADDGDYNEARQKLLQLCAIVPGLGCLRSLGSVEIHVGRYVEAYEHLLQATQLPTFASAPDEIRTLVEADLKRAYKSTGHLEVAAAGNPPARVDGGLVGDAPVMVAVLPGTHMVQVGGGETVRRQTVVATAGKVTQVEFEPLGETPPASATAPAPGETPSAVSSPLPPANAAVDVVGPDAPRSTSFWNGRTVTAVALGGLAMVGVTVGAVFAIKSNDNRVGNAGNALPIGGCLAASTPACSAYRDAVDGQHRDYSISLGSYVVAGAAGVAAITALIWPRGNRTDARTWIQPSLYGAAASVEFGGAF